MPSGHSHDLSLQHICEPIGTPLILPELGFSENSSPCIPRGSGLVRSVLDTFLVHCFRFHPLHWARIIKGRPFWSRF
jgi:hypothetical protein